MKLSKRLQAICDFVPVGSEIVDVGADHALVDIYLAKNKNCQCLAADISESSIIKANKNIAKAKATVETKLTDGLKDIKLENKIIIISGMGCQSILGILKSKTRNDLIISSNNIPSPLRKALQRKGYRIYKEVAIFDKRYYVVTYYKYKIGKKVDSHVSPFLINDYMYMQKLLNYYQIKASKEKNLFKKIKYQKVVRKIKKKVK